MNTKFVTFDSDKKIWSGRSRPQIYNTEVNLGYLLLQKLIQAPQNVCQISADSGIVLSNMDMYQRSIKIANFLKNEGLKQHDIIGLYALNSENLLPIMLGCFTLGIAVNPLSIVMGVDDIVYMWSKIKPKMVFSDANVLETALKAVDKMKLDVKMHTLMDKVDGYGYVNEVLEEKLDVENFEFPHLPEIASTTATITCSSGTTASPKGICKSHKQLIAHAFPIWNQNMNGTDVIFNSIPSYWTVHLYLHILGILYNNPVVITTENIEAEMWMDIIENLKITIAYSSPRFGKILMNSKKLRKMKDVRVLYSGGSVFTEQVVTDLQGICPNARLLFGYGITEADGVAFSVEEEGTVGTSSGYPFYNVQIKIVDETGKGLGPNEIGEILYKSPVPFSAYFGDPKSYAETFDADGFVKSGDLGYFDDNGRIHIIDRVKHMIKSLGSHKVTPIEIESVINEIDGVIQSCVVGVFNVELFYDKICVFVIKDKNKTEITEEFIKNYVAQRVIEEKKISGGVYFVDKFPMTPTGKVLVRELKNVAVELLKQQK